MKTDQRLIRDAVHTAALGAAVGAAMLLAAWLLVRWAGGLLRAPEPDIGPAPQIATADVDRVFEEHFAVFDRAADKIWQRHGLFAWWPDRALIYTGVYQFDGEQGRMRLDELLDGGYITEEERQAVRDMSALLEPSCLTCYAPIPDYGTDACRAWGFALRYDVPDGQTAWEDGYLSVGYLYARCNRKDHEDFTLACDAQRALVSRMSRYVDTWAPLDRDCWYRVTWRIRREEE